MINHAPNCLPDYGKRKRELDSFPKRAKPRLIPSVESQTPSPVDDLSSDFACAKEDLAVPGSPSPLLNLPQEIFDIIFGHLSTGDIINLSCINKTNRQWLCQMLFRSVKTTWQQLSDDCGFLQRFQHHIDTLRISNCYSYGEWHSDIFKMLQTTLPRLRHLLVNSNESSNWLKYRSLSTITSLTLYSEDPRSKTMRIFDLNHLVQFPNVTLLTLHNYHFNWDDASSTTGTLKLSKLTLNGCSWEYPFKLSQFNQPNGLTSLTIIYHNHSFILSERFNEYLTKVDEGLSSVTELTLECTKSLSPHLLQSILDTYPNLQLLQLLNWHVVADVFVSQYLTKLDWKHISRFTISLQGQPQPYITECCKQYLPRVKSRILFTS